MCDVALGRDINSQEEHFPVKVVGSLTQMPITELLSTVEETEACCKENHSEVLQRECPHLRQVQVGAQKSSGLCSAAVWRDHTTFLLVCNQLNHRNVMSGKCLIPPQDVPI